MFFFICITFCLIIFGRSAQKIRNISIKGFLRVLDICCCSVCIERGSHVVSVLINCVIFAIPVRFYFMFFVFKKTCTTLHLLVLMSFEGICCVI